MGEKITFNDPTVIETTLSIAFGAFVGLLPSPSATLGPIAHVVERIGIQLTFMSFAILVGSPIAGAIRADPLGFVGASIYGGLVSSSLSLDCD